MNPITPHLSEELAHLDADDFALNDPEPKDAMKSLKFVSTSSWPVTDESKINLIADVGEDFVRETIEGMRAVQKLAKLDASKKFTLFIAESWLYDLVNLLSREVQVTRNMGEIMRKVLEVEALKLRGKEVSKVVTALLKDVSKIPLLVTSQEEELKVIKEAQSFLEKEFNCPIEIFVAEESIHPKAKSALPGRAGILVE
jgi:leucyl-tRNA synthetase